MSFFQAPPKFLADNPDWVVRYKAEADALAAADARVAVEYEAERTARKAMIEARAARLAGKKVESEDTLQERVTHAATRANLARKAQDHAAQAFYKAWASDSATLAELSRAELARCVEAGRRAVAEYGTAYDNFFFAIQRLNMDDAATNESVSAAMTGGMGLNSEGKVRDALKYLSRSTEALAKALAVIEAAK